MKPFMKRGKKVMIRYVTVDGHKIDEGMAELVKFICPEGNGNEQWEVKFEGDILFHRNLLYRRVVYLSDYCGEN